MGALRLQAGVLLALKDEVPCKRVQLLARAGGVKVPGGEIDGAQDLPTAHGVAVFDLVDRRQGLILHLYQPAAARAAGSVSAITSASMSPRNCTSVSQNTGCSGLKQGKAVGARAHLCG